MVWIQPQCFQNSEYQGQWRAINKKLIINQLCSYTVMEKCLWQRSAMHWWRQDMKEHQPFPHACLSPFAFCQNPATRQKTKIRQLSLITSHLAMRARYSTCLCSRTLLIVIWDNETDCYKWEPRLKEDGVPQNLFKNISKLLTLQTWNFPTSIFATWNSVQFSKSSLLTIDF